MKKMLNTMCILAALCPVAAVGWYTVGANMPDQVVEVILDR